MKYWEKRSQGTLRPRHWRFGPCGLDRLGGFAGPGRHDRLSRFDALRGIRRNDGKLEVIRVYY